MNTAPEIKVVHIGTGVASVTMTTRDGRSLRAFIDGHESFTLSSRGAPTFITMDLRRLADTIDAVYAGTYQVTPELPTGRK